MRDTLFLVNPTAGSGRARQIWEGLRSRLDTRARTVVATSRESAERALLAVLEQGRCHVVCVGGDGTVNLAAECLVAAGQVSPPPSLGIVPAGTGSDLASSLGLPERAEEALSVAVGENHRPIDVTAIRTDRGAKRVSINVAAAGVAGRVDEVLQELPSGRKKRYLPATLKALASYRAVEATILVDRKRSFSGRYYLVAVANGPTFGRGMRVAPEAVVDDGQLDFVLVGNLPRWQLPWRLPQLVLGRHLGARWVTFVQGKELDLELKGTEPRPIDIDGEMVHCRSASFVVQPGALEIAIG